MSCFRSVSSVGRFGKSCRAAANGSQKLGAARSAKLMGSDTHHAEVLLADSERRVFRAEPPVAKRPPPQCLRDHSLGTDGPRAAQPPPHHRSHSQHLEEVARYESGFGHLRAPAYLRRREKDTRSDHTAEAPAPSLPLL